MGFAYRVIQSKRVGIESEKRTREFLGELSVKSEMVPLSRIIKLAT